MDNPTTTTNSWEARYQQGEAHWDRGQVSPNLHHWIDSQQLQPCRILIPGCGNGYEALYLAENGFDVVAIDIAVTPIANLQKALAAKHLKAELIQADFFNWTPNEPFDAIYEQTSLCALPPEQWEAYEQCLYHWLKPKGKLLAQFMQNESNKESKSGPPFHCDVTDMVHLFPAQRWQWSEEQNTQVIHSGELRERVYLLEK